MIRMALFLLALLIAGLAGASWWITRGIERDYPPIGTFTTVNGNRMHLVDTGRDAEDPEKPVIVFIHGAGGNLRDAHAAYRDRLSDEFRILFIDRPGHGYSQGFENSSNPEAQAKAIAGLLDALEIEKAILIGHSYGGLITGVFGVNHPQKTSGLVFLAPVSHPWTTGISWQYDVGALPVIGWLFSRLIVPTAGGFMYPGAVKNVFAPNTPPADYKQTSGTQLVLRPANFRANSKDVAAVSDFVDVFHTRYKEINVPTVIMHGDADIVTSPEIHSINGLAKDIADAKLVLLEGIGHMPDHFVADRIETEIRQLAASVAAQ